LSGRVPRRVDEATKLQLLWLIDRAVADGWQHRRACTYLELDEGRAWRWRRRRDAGCLKDGKPGSAVHGLRPEEVTAIVELFEEWGDVDRSHRKLAHRGSYLDLVWVSPATVRRVLAAHGLVFKRPRRVIRPERRPFPQWADYTRNSIWIYDVTRFAGCPEHAVFAVMDLVTRKWITELVSIEETSTQVQVVFMDALELEGLLDLVEARQDAVLADDDPSPFAAAVDVLAPVLLAVSDNGPQMTSGSTREFMAMCAIAQHFGRPGTPTDQAWIESLFGHIKADWPHLDKIRDPDTLRAELADVRRQYNTIRLHAGIGYVTPDDEHQGRGPRIRAARKRGLRHARWARIIYHQTQKLKAKPPEPRR
jgi:transposase InsO family protein